MKMTISCPFCSEQKKIKKHGTYPVINGANSERVRRYFCRGCGNSFSEHTSIEKEEASNGKRIIKRKLSAYLKAKRKKKSDEVYSDIQRYITNHGIPSVKEITESEAVSPKTYYKYLRSIAINIGGEYFKRRKEIKPRKFMLLEFSKKHEGLDFKIKFLLLVDVRTRSIYNVFFHEKMRQKVMRGVFNEASFEQQSQWKLDYTYNTEHIVKHLAHLKEKHPKLTIYLRCSEHLQKKLMASGIYKVAPSKIAKKFISDLMDFGFGKVLRLTLTLKGGNKRYSSEATKRIILKSYTRETVLKLINLYNVHQVEQFNMRDNKNRKIKPQHRRLSKRARPNLRAKKSKK